MQSMYQIGDSIVFGGARGEIAEIMETYRKNVLVVDLTGERPDRLVGAKSIGLFEHPGGSLQFMTVTDWLPVGPARTTDAKI